MTNSQAKTLLKLFSWVSVNK